MVAVLGRMAFVTEVGALGLGWDGGKKKKKTVDENGEAFRNAIPRLELAIAPPGTDVNPEAAQSSEQHVASRSDIAHHFYPPPLHPNMADNHEHEGASVKEQIVEACRRNNVELLQEIIAQCKNDDEISNLMNRTTTVMGNHLYHEAALQGNYEVIDLLLDQPNFECDPVNRQEGDTPLHSAIRWINSEPPAQREFGNALVEMMLEAGSNPRVKNKAKLTALQLVDPTNKALRELIQKHEYASLNQGDFVDASDVKTGGSSYASNTFADAPGPESDDDAEFSGSDDEERAEFERRKAAKKSRVSSAMPTAPLPLIPCVVFRLKSIYLGVLTYFLVASLFQASLFFCFSNTDITLSYRYNGVGWSPYLGSVVLTMPYHEVGQQPVADHSVDMDEYCEYADPFNSFLVYWLLFEGRGHAYVIFHHIKVVVELGILPLYLISKLNLFQQTHVGSRPNPELEQRSRLEVPQWPVGFSSVSFRVRISVSQNANRTGGGGIVPSILTKLLHLIAGSVVPVVA
ncbi:hypothetical protein TruAng_005637 [Truncatella angustata]|nr:hypothetical protein TruAng_005637 [Truncatella angustata]